MATTPAPLRLLAEWEPQEGVLLAWPHEGTDWADDLATARACYLDLIATIRRFHTVFICVPNPAAAVWVHSMTGPWFHRLHTLEVQYDDTWVRDSGPLTATRDSRCLWLDFRFDGWGGKFPHRRDDALVTALARKDCFRHLAVERFDWVLEGGAIDTDGAGTVLTTARCFSHRWPNFSKDLAERRLRESLACDRVLWLDHGELIGDDTDSHVDILARFSDSETIVYQGCHNPRDPHYPFLGAMAEQLAQFRTRSGQRYRLLELPLPSPIRHGRRYLAASYANFLLLSQAVLVPTYDDPADDGALAIMEKAFPNREVVPVDCRALIKQGGSLHCATMQLPQGTLSEPSDR